MCSFVIESSSVLPLKCSLLTRKSSAILDHFRKLFRNVCLAFGQLLENLRKSSESVRNIVNGLNPGASV